MGTLGKMMVLVHGAIAIAVLGWAFAVYTQRIQWNTSIDKENLGIFEQQQTKATELNTAIDKAFTRWSGNYATNYAVPIAPNDKPRGLDYERQTRRAFYPGQLNLVRTGKFNKVDETPSVQLLVNAPNGYLNITQSTKRNPVQVNGESLLSIATYYDNMQRIFDEFTKSQMATAQHQATRDELNKKIIGTMGPPATKGLRTLLQEQRNMEDAAIAQERYDNQYLVNYEVEFGLLKKRRDALQSRMKELTDAR